MYFSLEFCRHFGRCNWPQSGVRGLDYWYCLVYNPVCPIEVRLTLVLFSCIMNLTLWCLDTFKIFMINPQNPVKFLDPHAYIICFIVNPTFVFSHICLWIHMHKPLLAYMHTSKQNAQNCRYWTSHQNQPWVKWSLLLLTGTPGSSLWWEDSVSSHKLSQAWHLELRPQAEREICVTRWLTVSVFVSPLGR